MAFPIGGEGNTDIIVLEVHYDNPNGDVGKLCIMILKLQLSVCVRESHQK